MSVFVIAEAGSSHDGGFPEAKRLITIAKESGASAVKYQYWSDPVRLAARRRAWPALRTYRRYQIPPDWLPLLKEEAHTLDLAFMVTCFLPEDIEVVEPLVEKFKVASFEAQDFEFIRLHLRFDRQLVISTGLTDRDALSRLRELRAGAGTLHYGRTPKIQLLHCRSAYPCPIGDLSLGLIRGEELDGFSDHSGHELAGAFAVMAGARIVEVHFRSEDTPEANPDYPHSLTPDALARYIGYIRLAEQMRGSDGRRFVSLSEEPLIRHVVRRP